MQTNQHKRDMTEPLDASSPPINNGSLKEKEC